MPFIVAPGMAARGRQAGFTNVTEVQPWQGVTVGDLTITAAPAEHGVPEVTCRDPADCHTVLYSLVGCET